MNRHAIKSGVILGIISVIISLLMYVTDVSLFATWWLQLILFVFYLALVCYFGIRYRNETGGYLSFGQSWVYSFVALAISGLIGSIFSILLFNVVDPELPEVITEQVIRNSESMMQGFGVPEDEIDKALEEARDDTREGFTAFGFMRGYLLTLIGYAVFSLVSGAIIKKKEPEFGA